MLVPTSFHPVLLLSVSRRSVSPRLGSMRRNAWCSKRPGETDGRYQGSVRVQRTVPRKERVPVYFGGRFVRRLSCRTVVVFGGEGR